ncbi:MAG: pyrroline-5-carboxylate reductase [Muribaculaceae bacterium]|nr:pyrroline-5-carboxylate reductase [Muribaculaceae bacterium]
MKIAIIGAGNIGGAIASGLMQSEIGRNFSVVISDPDTAKTSQLAEQYQNISAEADNQKAVSGADIVILAVKPWLVEKVLGTISLQPSQILASVAAGITSEQLKSFCNAEVAMFRIIPNTAISLRESMNIISSCNATKEQEAVIMDIFNQLGFSMLVAEAQMAAGTALSSCGIAYVLKYIQAGMQAGIEMGIYPHDAMMMVAQSVKGAAELILKGNTHPATEIDKVTTPGGITIKGINTLESEGFPAAIIKAMKSSK